MTYHLYDQVTGLYLETVEAEIQPSNSVSGSLPDRTDQYTIAFIDGDWVSVLRPELEISENKIIAKPDQSSSVADPKPVLKESSKRSKGYAKNNKH
jgi:hypothetical protein